MIQNKLLMWLCLTLTLTFVLGSSSNFSVSAQPAMPNQPGDPSIYLPSIPKEEGTSGLAQTEIPSQPGANSIYLPSIPKEGSESVLMVEGTVERIESTYQEALIVSRATLLIERVLAGKIDEERVVILYLGGTVNDVTLKVSHEPWLTETMQVRVTLHRLDSGEYEIREVEHDLIVLSESVQPSYTQIGWIWPDSSIPVPIQINANTGDIAGTGERQPVIDAITTWSAVSGSKFSFQSTNSSCAPIVRDNINCVGWQSGSGPGSAIGQAFLWASGSTTFVLVESDIVFYEQNENGSIQWSTSPSGSQIDVESVALHELGHSLGLDHSSAGTVMAPSILMGTTVRTLHSDDINGIRALYPGVQATHAYVASNGSATGACTPNDKCSTVARGANQVGDHGTVWITAGTYPETITIDRPMTLDSPGGTVTVGN